jgi:hypothetical protein
MTKSIIDMAREAGIRDCTCDGARGCLERFAALVLANSPPDSSMAWQEGNEAGRLSEREACCAIVWGLCESDNVAQRTVDAIRARGNT